LKADTAEEWARFLVQDVFFDVAGFPAVLRSDRGNDYTSSIIEAVNDLLGIKHVFGAAYHPQSQGYVEGRHKSINSILKAYSLEHPRKWARYSKLAQWCLRATPRADRDNKSPYEIVTGRKPQGPIDAIFKMTSSKKLTPGGYVTDLFKYMQHTYEKISAQLNAEYAKRMNKNAINAKVSQNPKVGDLVFVKKPPVAIRDSEGEKQTSKRLKTYADTKVYEVERVQNEKSFYLICPDTRNADKILFSQPVALDRLILIEDFAMEDPINAEEELWILIRTKEKCASKQWYKRQIVAQNSTGSVRIVDKDGGDAQIVDLSEREWSWTSSPAESIPSTRGPVGAEGDLSQP